MSRLHSFLSVSTIAVLFVVASYFSSLYIHELHGNDHLRGVWGMVEYVLVTVVAVVVAPVSTIPLLPVASAMWGPVWAALLSIVGWTMGAQIAYELARSVARPWVEKRFRLGTLDRYARVLAGPNPFWTLLWLRMCIPVDVLSYAVGLSVPMGRWPYFFATLVGVAPFAFVFAYASELPPLYQLTALFGALVAASVGMYRVTNRSASDRQLPNSD